MSLQVRNSDKPNGVCLRDIITLTVTSLLYRDHAAQRPKLIIASTSTESKWLNLPEDILRYDDYSGMYYRDFEAALKEPDQRYCDLNTLCSGAEVPLTGKDYEDASRFIELCTGSRECTPHSGESVEEWENLPDSLCPTNERPDVWISEGSNVVILVAEVHSGEGPEGYKITLNKEVIGLMTQLRMLRYQYNINQVVGFVLPKSRKPFFVTKVTVRFEALHFHYTFERVPSLEDVQASIRAGYQANKDAIGQLRPSLNRILAYPIKLTGPECIDLGKELELEERVRLEQVQSWNSFILQANGKVYKYCLNSALYYKIIGITATIKSAVQYQEQIDRLLFHEQKLPVFNLSIPFLQFPAAIPPLSTSEARECLVPLLKSTKEAIDQLHSFDFAHLDIRLPNICFRNEGGKVFAVLIDFECVEEYLSSEDIPEYDSCLYRPLYPQEGLLTLKQCDFMQLGWMAVWILHFDNALAGYDPHKLDTAWREGHIPLRTREDPFVNQLVRRGVFSDQHLNSRRVFGEANRQSLETVLGIQ